MALKEKAGSSLCYLIHITTSMKTITKIPLGKNGPLVSKLGLGCMRMSYTLLGPVNDESESIAHHSYGAGQWY
jgi:hypothetical protein